MSLALEQWFLGGTCSFGKHCLSMTPKGLRLRRSSVPRSEPFARVEGRRSFHRSPGPIRRSAPLHVHEADRQAPNRSSRMHGVCPISELDVIVNRFRVREVVPLLARGRMDRVIAQRSPKRRAIGQERTKG
eukprot:106013-Alexandrium_andersonii.AAC.1